MIDDIRVLKVGVEVLKVGLAAPRTPGWDQTIIHLAIKHYGSVEDFIKAEISRIEEIIRLHNVNLLDEE